MTTLNKLAGPINVALAIYAASHGKEAIAWGFIFPMILANYYFHWHKNQSPVHAP